MKQRLYDRVFEWFMDEIVLRIRLLRPRNRRAYNAHQERVRQQNIRLDLFMCREHGHDYDDDIAPISTCLRCGMVRERRSNSVSFTYPADYMYKGTWK